MPRFSYKTDSDEDKRASPEETARQLHEQEQQSGFDRDFNELTDPDHLEKDGKEGDLGDDEAKGTWNNGVTGNDSGLDKPRLQKVFAFAKKRGAVFGLVGLVGVGGAFAGTFLGPASMLVSVMENFTLSNDSSSTSMERRFFKVFGNMTSGDPVCANSTKTIKCKMGRISNKALSQLSTKGFVPYFDNGTTGVTKKTGYPDRNPSGYTIDMGDGRSVNINAADVPGFLAKKENAKIASRVLGSGGAFNLRLKAWSGKYITKKIFTKFGIDRKGGLADGKNKGTKYSDVLEKLRKKIPGISSTQLAGIKSSVQTKVSKHMNASKKGGVGYTIAVAGCVAVKAPGYIAAGVAAIQLAQVMPYVMNIALSPGSKLKASGVDPAASDFSGDDMAAIGALLTSQTARASDGKMTSALDSPYLQAAMGVNTNKIPVSQKYTPGFSVLTNETVMASVKADKQLAPACNAIMSPAAMYTAMAVDAAITVAASATIIAGVVKIIGSFAIQEVAGSVVEAVAGEAAMGVVTGLAQNDDIPTAEGEELGDVLGVSASAFFAAGGMARSLPTLTEAQIPEFAALQKENQSFQRDMDIASLSPFDTSSRYTFLGSIVHNMQTAAYATGSYDGGIASFISTLAQLPMRSMSTLTGTANAASGFSDASCSYAQQFGLKTDKDSTTPAINLAGLPCTGLTGKMGAMTTSTAISLILGEGWLDESKSIKDNATIDDLVRTGFIKADTPLSNYLISCSDASTGDYLFNAAGCSVDTTVADPNKVTDQTNATAGNCGEDGCITKSEDVGAATPSLINGDSMAAIPVFLLDFQAAQSINGEDDETGKQNASAGTEIDQAAVYEDSTTIECAAGTDDAGNSVGYRNGSPINIRLCSIPNTTDDSHGGGPLKVNSRISGATLELTKSLAASRGETSLRVADGFRTMEEQQQALDEYGPDRAAQPGYSNHQMGLAIDFQLGSNNGAERPGDPVYDWLVANAKGFGFGKIAGESWHWQALGADNSVAM